MSAIDACRLHRYLGMDETLAVRILQDEGICYEICRCDDPSPQGHPMAPEGRVLWAAAGKSGGPVTLYVASPQVESTDVQAAKERHFGETSNSI